jgi:hypothetical protein
LDWWVHFEETNKADVHHFAVTLSPSENELMSGLRLAQDEDGILTWSIGKTLDPKKVYRVIGAYHVQGRLEEMMSWSQRVPVLGRALRWAPPVFATSAWYEVTMEQ